MPLDYLKRIAQTPAPTFHEGERAQLMLQLWRELGYAPEIDTAGNVIAKIEPLQQTKGRGALVLASHLDTVFEAGTDVNVRQKGARLIGPGVGDNSSSLAVLTAFLRDLDAGELTAPLWVVANTAEEGLGDLRGAKTLLAKHHADIAAFVAVDGYLGMAATHAVGVRRYRATYTGEGGHSWGHALPSPIHALARAVTQLYALPLPHQPRTTLNVGMVEGGVSINSIAASATMLIDLRSMSPEELRKLDHATLEVLHEAARNVGVGLSTERVGDRPSGALRPGPLLDMARSACESVGLSLSESASSTDANAAVPYKLPALSMGVYQGADAHTLEEWVDPTTHARGLAMLQDFVRRYQQQPL